MLSSIISTISSLLFNFFFIHPSLPLSLSPSLPLLIDILSISTLLPLFLILSLSHSLNPSLSHLLTHSLPSLPFTSSAPPKNLFNRHFIFFCNLLWAWVSWVSRREKRKQEWWPNKSGKENSDLRIPNKWRHCIISVILDRGVKDFVTTVFHY